MKKQLKELIADLRKTCFWKQLPREQRKESIQYVFTQFYGKPYHA